MSDTANAPPSGPVVRNIPRRYVALALIVVAIVLLGVLVIVRDNSSPGATSTVETFSAAPTSLVSSLDLPASVYDTVGTDSPTVPVTPLRATAAKSLWQASDGSHTRPVVFFYGAEFAPYAAAARWPLVLALSRFGTFTQLGEVQSSANAAFPNLSTFTFWKVRYDSKWIELQTVERYSALDPTGAHYLSLQAPDSQQAAALADYGSRGTFAFVDLADRWVLSGSSVPPAAFDGLSQSQIAGDLTSPASPLTQAVVASANQITAAICSVDGRQPGAVCGSRGVQAADRVLGIPAR